MNSSLAVIGLDRIGLSLGLALTQKGRISSISAWDGDKAKVETAKQLNIFTSLPEKLEQTIKSADLTFLSQPLDEIRETLHTMKPWIKKDAVIFYTSSFPATAAGWVKEELQASVHFAALTPSINPNYLDDPQDNAPHADFFENSRIFISHSDELPANVVQIAIEITGMLGAEPCFASMEEVNGLQTITQVLPAVTMMSFANAIINEPGWKDASQLAGIELASIMKMLDSLAVENLAISLLNERENAQRVMARLQDSLIELSSLVESVGDRKLQDKLSLLQMEGRSWLNGRKKSGTGKALQTSRK